MSPLENLVFAYGYQGGEPPASFEGLVVRQDGNAQYVAGNTWSRQPPFNEIGVYEKLLGERERGDLKALVDAVYERRNEIHPSPLYGDSGAESLVVMTENEPWRISWNPNEPPTGLHALLGAVRQAISAIRDNPLGVLESEMKWSGPEQVLLRLVHKGTLPVTVHWQNQPTEEFSSARLAFSDQRIESPLDLIHLTPIALRANQSDSLIVERIEPGQARSFQFPVKALDQQTSVVSALVHLFWQVEPVPAAAELQDGWMLTYAQR